MVDGLRIHDPDTNQLVTYSDKIGRLIHSEIVPADTSGSTTLSGFFNVIDGDLEFWSDEVYWWNYGINDAPGIDHHWGTQWYCDGVSGTTDFYNFWRDFYIEEYGSFFGSLYFNWFLVPFIEIATDETMASGITVVTISGANQTRWDDLYTNSISGTHPYYPGIIEDNLDEIGDLLDAVDFDTTDYWTYFGTYDDFSTPYSEANGETMGNALDAMYDDITAGQEYASTENMTAYAVATTASGMRHTVALSISGQNLVITYTFHDSEIGTDPVGYYYSGDSIIYVVGYK